jgi:hypothetical protein
MVIKKPYTPAESSQNQRKNSRGSGSMRHEAKTPVNTMTEVSSSMATETPSTPTE